MHIGSPYLDKKGQVVESATGFAQNWALYSGDLGPLLLTWFNCNPSMDKWLSIIIINNNVYDEITYPFQNFIGATVEV